MIRVWPLQVCKESSTEVIFSVPSAKEEANFHNRSLLSSTKANLFHISSSCNFTELVQVIIQISRLLEFAVQGWKSDTDFLLLPGCGWLKKYSSRTSHPVAFGIFTSGLG